MFDSEATKVMSYAVDNNNMGMLKKSILNGADPNYKDEYGFTFLMKTIINNNIEGVDILLKAGADINGYSNYVNIFRGIAQDMHGGNMQKAIEFWKDTSGDRVKKQSGVEGDNALICAIDNDQMEIALKLITEGIDINYANYIGHNALSAAVDKGSIYLIKVFVEIGVAYPEYDLLVSILFWGRLDIAKELLKTGVDIQQCLYKEVNIILDFARRNDIRVVKFLLKAGADIMVKDKDGKTSFDLATDPELKRFINKEMQKANIRNKKSA